MNWLNCCCCRWFDAIADLAPFGIPLRPAFQYKTEKFIRVDVPRVGVFFRFCQFLAFLLVLAQLYMDDGWAVKSGIKSQVDLPDGQTITGFIGPLPAGSPTVMDAVYTRSQTDGKIGDVGSSPNVMAAVSALGARVGLPDDTSGATLFGRVQNNTEQVQQIRASVVEEQYAIRSLFDVLNESTDVRFTSTASDIIAKIGSADDIISGLVGNASDAAGAPTIYGRVNEVDRWSAPR